jgi:hypothetical protein
MLNGSLEKLGNAFKVDVVKGKFPHKFANTKTLFYKGDTPHFKYYTDILNEFSIEDYNKLCTREWDFKLECLKYLEKDLVSLYLIMEKFKKGVYAKHNVDVTKCITISKLASNIFMQKYYNNNIALISNRDMWNSIKKGYYGGIAEVYKPYGENLYYYDVNSLYPYTALNDMPGV